MSSPQSRTDAPGAFFAFLLFVSIVWLLASIIKLFADDFRGPQLKVGDCVIQYENGKKDLENWEKKKPIVVVKVEEIGKKRYRTTRFYIFKFFQKEIVSRSDSESIRWLDKDEKIDCNAGIAEIWNAHE